MNKIGWNIPLAFVLYDSLGPGFTKLRMCLAISFSNFIGTCENQILLLGLETSHGRRSCGTTDIEKRHFL